MRVRMTMIVRVIMVVMVVLGLCSLVTAVMVMRGGVGAGKQ